MEKQNIRVVVVGGGFGGIKTALELANKPGVSVQLISDNTHFEYHGALYRSAVGHSPMEVVIPLRDIFKNAKNVELVLDKVSVIDAKKHRIASETGNIYSYDKVVFALGNVINYFGIPGVEEHSQTMHSINATIKLRTKLVELLSKKQTRPIRIAIIGAGPSGVELAGELPQFAKFIAKKFRIPPPKLNIILLDAADRVLPSFKPASSKIAEKRLKKLGIEVHLNVEVETCGSDSVCLRTGNLKADLIIWTAGGQSSPFYRQNSEVFTLNKSRVVVSEYLQPQHWRNVYIIGDNADTKYSGMAQTALDQGAYVADSILRELHNKKVMTYKDKRPSYIVAIGGRWALAQIGTKTFYGSAGWALRRQADLAIFRNFQPYKEAIKTWRKASKISGKNF